MARFRKTIPLLEDHSDITTFLSVEVKQGTAWDRMYSAYTIALAQASEVSYSINTSKRNETPKWKRHKQPHFPITYPKKDQGWTHYYILHTAWQWCCSRSEASGLPQCVQFTGVTGDEKNKQMTVCAERTFNADRNAYQLLASLRGNYENAPVQVGGEDTEWAYCQLNACLSDTKTYHKLVAKHGVQRLKKKYRRDGCSTEGMQQDGESCWYTAVVLLLSKINPLYELLREDIRNWVDYCRESRFCSQESTQPHILPKDVHDLYYSDEYTFDFKTGGNVYYLFKGILTASNIFPMHCTMRDPSQPYSNDRVWAKDADDDASQWGPNPVLPDLHHEQLLLKELNLDLLFHKPHPQKFHINYVYGLWDLRRFVHFVWNNKQSMKHLLGGTLSLPPADNGHDIAFTMCDGNPVICSWNKCILVQKEDDIDEVIKKFRIPANNECIIDATMFIYAPKGTHHTKWWKGHAHSNEGDTILLYNSTNTVHLYVEIQKETAYMDVEGINCKGVTQHVESGMERKAGRLPMPFPKQGSEIWLHCCKFSYTVTYPVGGFGTFESVTQTKDLFRGLINRNPYYTRSSVAFLQKKIKLLLTKKQNPEFVNAWHRVMKMLSEKDLSSILRPGNKELHDLLIEKGLVQGHIFRFEKMLMAQYHRMAQYHQ